MWLNKFQTYRTYTTGRGLHFIEPLKTKAPPSDAGVRPYCCYRNTIVFLKSHRLYAEWDRITTQWDLIGERFSDRFLGLSGLAPLVFHEEKIYELASGTVRWDVDIQQWWMDWGAFRICPSDCRWTDILTDSLFHFPPQTGGRL